MYLLNWNYISGITCKILGLYRVVYNDIYSFVCLFNYPLFIYLFIYLFLMIEYIMNE